MYNKLKKILGEYDAVNEFVELAIRDFKKTYSTMESQTDFLKNKSLEHNLYITSYDSNLFYKKISLNYIVSVHQCFETFLKEINDVGKKLGNYNWKYKKDDESWLICVVNNVLSVEEKEKNIYLIEACEYYRLVRNVAVHDFFEKKDPELMYKKLIGHIPELKLEYIKLNAPNEVSNIEFDDFILFSRVVQDLAKEIHNYFRYDPDKILDNVKLSNLKKFKNNENRLKKSIESLLNSKYHLDKDTFDKCSNKIYNKIMAH